MNFDEPIQSPPSDIQAEAASLAGMIKSGAARGKLLAMLGPADFFRPAHGLIYRALAGMDAAGRPVDLITLVDALRGAGRLEEVGGPEYLCAVADSLPAVENAEYYALIVRGHAIRRATITAAMDIRARAYDLGVGALEMLDAAQRRLLDLDPRLKGGAGKDADLAEAIQAAALAIEDAHEQAGMVGVRTGLVDVDDVCGGFRPGENVVLAGRTGSGKSSIALGAAVHAAASGRGVVIVSAEMPAAQVGKRILQSRAQVWGTLLRNGQLRTQDWEAIRRAQAELSPLPVHIVGRRVTIPEVGAIIRRCEARWSRRVELVVLDYIQLMQPHTGRSRYEQVSAMSLAGKELALSQGCVVLSISQLSREGVKPVGGKEQLPTLWGLKETGSLENDADYVLLLYAPDDGRQRCPHDEQAIEVWLKVAKARESGTTPWPVEHGQEQLSGIRLRWFPGWTLLTDWEGTEPQ